MEFFKSEKINDHITLIKTITAENLFLIEGRDKALLVDTSEGAGDLKSFVEKLIDKPLTVVVTHGHIDHAMGAVQFDNVYMNLLDKDVYDSMSDIPQREGYVRISAGLKKLPDDLKVSFVNSDKAYEKFHDLKDETEFDLGGYHVIAYHVPGHTPGMTMLLLVEDRILITGDGANTATFLFADYCPSVAQYRDELDQINKKLWDKFDKIYMSHHEVLAPKELLSNLVSVCDDVLAGNSDEQKYEFMGETAYIAKSVNPGFVRKDGGFGNLVYNPQKIR